MDDETEVQLIYITISPNREKVLKAFKNEEMLRPSEIARKLNLRINTVSDNLKKLTEREYIYLMNPQFHSHRFYKLTEKGKKILDLLE